MCSLWVGKLEGKGQLRRPRYRWVVCINIDVVEIEWGGVDWNGLAQDKNKWKTCEFDKELFGSIKCWETTEWLFNWWPLE
jgi:hypothetical protein